LKSGTAFGARVQLANFFERHCSHLAVAIHAAVHGGVVHDYELAVGSGANIGFDEVRAGLERGTVSRHRVLRMMQMLAAVRDGDDLR
jgi:hypothetical protein